jgi:cytochrome c5
MVITHNGREVNFSGVLYPAMSPSGSATYTQDCSMCHVNSSEQNLPIGLNQVTNPQDWFNPVQSVASSCSGCHASKPDASHFLAGVDSLGESCTVCHSAGAQFAVGAEHAFALSECAARGLAWPLSSVQDDHRAARFDAMVRTNQTAGGENAGCRGRRPHPIHAGQLDQQPRALDGEHPGLVRFPAALVGAADDSAVQPFPLPLQPVCAKNARLRPYPRWRESLPRLQRGRPEGSSLWIRAALPRLAGIAHTCWRSRCRHGDRQAQSRKAHHHGPSHRPASQIMGISLS